jgi:hypothetical protein
VLETSLATQSDVTIVRGRRTLDPEDQSAVTNPTLIVEVLSRSAEEYDRGDEFEHDKPIPSLSSACSSASANISLRSGRVVQTAGRRQLLDSAKSRRSVRSALS